MIVPVCRMGCISCFIISIQFYLLKWFMVPIVNQYFTRIMSHNITNDHKVSYSPVHSIDKLKTWVPLEEQQILTFPEHLMSSVPFSRVRVAQSLVFCVLFGISLFVHFSLFFWQFRCFFFDLGLLDYPFGIFKPV